MSVIERDDTDESESDDRGSDSERQRSVSDPELRQLDGALSSTFLTWPALAARIVVLGHSPAQFAAFCESLAASPPEIVRLRINGNASNLLQSADAIALAAALRQNTQLVALQLASGQVRSATSTSTTTLCSADDRCELTVLGRFSMRCSTTPLCATWMRHRSFLRRTQSTTWLRA